MLIGLMDKPGALNEVLSILAEKNINLSKLESRPIKGKQWKYLFFIDMIGHIEDQNIKQGCDKLQEICSYVEWLGSYPLAESQSIDSQ